MTTGKKIPVVNAYWRGDNVIVCSRDDHGNRRQRAVRAEYACYIEAAELVPGLRRILEKAPGITGFEREGEWVRVDFRSWADLKEWTHRWTRGDGDYDPESRTRDNRSRFERLKVPTFEADVNPVRRFMIDHSIELQRPRRCYLDLEVDSRKTFDQMRAGEARILTWAIVGEDGEWVVGCLDEDTDQAERRLLQELIEELEPYDQIAAWNGDGFDFPVMQERCAMLGISVVFRRHWLLLDHLAVFRDMNLNASESGDEKQSFALGRIATAVLGETKDDLDANKTWEYWEAGGESRDKLIEYNRRDSDLLRQIEEKTGFLDLLFTVCEVCNVLPDSHGRNGTVFVEGYLLAMAHARGQRFPSHWTKTSSNKFEGAYVMAPEASGIMRSVHVADFAALYPSIIQTWNMSPETLDDWRREGNPLHAPPSWWKAPEKVRPPELCEVPGASAFKREPIGMLAEAVTELRRLRKSWNDEKAKQPPGTEAWKRADRRSMAYKVAANTFYGVIGSPFSRFFVREVAESVTAAGRWLITETIKAAEARGWRVVYCDTDSIFVVGVSEEAFAAFVKWCNAELYPKLLADLGCPRNEISLAYEKEFDRIVFVAKKRYAGRFAHYKGTRATEDSKPEIKGLEFKRGDSIRLARSLQSEVIDALMTGEEDPGAYHEKVEEWRARVLRDELDVRDFLQSKTVKDLAAYKQRTKKDGTQAAQPLHVEVAKKLKERGADVSEGTRIEFIVTDGAAAPMKAIPLQDYEPGAEDRFYLWEALVYPPTERLLAAAFPGEEWRRYEKVRPSKRARVCDEQLSLGLPEPPPKKRKRVTKKAPTKKRSDAKKTKKRSEAGKR